MGSTNKKSKERDRKKRKRDRSRSKDRHSHRHHHKHKKHKRNREERSPSIDLSDLSLSDIEVNYNDETYKDSTQTRPENQEQLFPQEFTQSTSSSKEVSLSVADTNKIRAKLGLKPLVETVPVKSINDLNIESDYKPGEEIHNPPENISDKMQIQKLREKIAAHREKRKYQNKLNKVKSLGESDEEPSALQWVSKSRKIYKDKQEAEKRNKMLAELDEQFGVGDMVEEEVKHAKKSMYSSNSLSGLKVEHEASRFEDGHTTILTLKDSNVLDNDEDTLVNVNIIDVERVERNLKIKRKKTDAVEYDAPEMDEYGNIVQNVVLEKYDEEIDGEEKKKSFRIGNRGEGINLEEVDRKVKKISKLRQLSSLERPEAQLATEYLTPGEMVSFKKVKKKKKKKKFTADDLEPIDDDVSNYGCRNSFKMGDSSVKRGVIEDENSLLRVINEDVGTPAVQMEIDEEEDTKDIELQEAIARSRRAKMETKNWTNENMDAHITIKKEETDVYGQELNLTMNNTDEFCRTLGDIPTYGLAGNRTEEEGAILQAMSPAKESDEKHGAWEEVGIDNTKVEIGNDTLIPILEEEPSAGSGIAMALALAKKKGYLEKDDSKKTANAALQHLRAVHYSIEDKAIEEDRRVGGRGDRYMGPITDFREKDSYKPDVNLEYVDDEGRKLNAKEAFRYLSHKFHGKGSGKNKLEKRMKKWKEELNMKYMNSSDTPLQTLERQKEKQKQLGTAYIVLSGNKTQESLDVQK